MNHVQKLHDSKSWCGLPCDNIPVSKRSSVCMSSSAVLTGSHIDSGVPQSALISLKADGRAVLFQARSACAITHQQC